MIIIVWFLNHYWCACGFCRQLQHPNIIQVMGSLFQDKQVIVLMALVDGPNLHDVIFSGNYQVFSMLLLLNAP